MRTDKKGATGVEPKTFYIEDRHLIHYATQLRASKQSPESGHYLKTQRHLFIVPAQANEKHKLTTWKRTTKQPGRDPNPQSST